MLTTAASDHGTVQSAQIGRPAFQGAASPGQLWRRPLLYALLEGAFLGSSLYFQGRNVRMRLPHHRVNVYPRLHPILGRLQGRLLGYFLEVAYVIDHGLLTLFQNSFGFPFALPGRVGVVICVIISVTFSLNSVIFVLLSLRCPGLLSSSLVALLCPMATDLLPLCLNGCFPVTASHEHIDIRCSVLVIPCCVASAVRMTRRPAC